MSGEIDCEIGREIGTIIRNSWRNKGRNRGRDIIGKMGGDVDGIKGIKRGNVLVFSSY